MSIIKLPPYVLDSTLDFTFNNVTSTGSLSVTANVTAGNIKSDHLLYSNGSPYVFTTNAAGTNTQIQFNDANSFAGSSSLTFNKTTNTLTVANVVVSTTANLGDVANLKITGGSANYYLKTDGNGTLSWSQVSSGSASLSGLSDVNALSPSAGDFLSYDTSSSKWVNTSMSILSPLTITDDAFTGTGSQTNFTLSVSPSGAVVAIGGVVQPKSYYTITGNTISFSTAPPASTPVAVTSFSGNVNLLGKATTVLNNAQPNITSVGTLTSLTVSGLTTLQQSSEVIQVKTSATGTVDHDMTTGATFYHTTPSANFTANFTNVPTTDSRVLVAALVIVQGTTPYIPTAVQIDGVSQTIKWLSSTAPTGTASKTDVISFSLMRVSSTWSVFGQYSTYG